RAGPRARAPAHGPRRAEPAAQRVSPSVRQNLRRRVPHPAEQLGRTLRSRGELSAGDLTRKTPSLTPRALSPPVAHHAMLPARLDRRSGSPVYHRDLTPPAPFRTGRKQMSECTRSVMSHLGLVVAFTIVASFPVQAHQEPGPERVSGSEPAVLEEIVVTTRRRDERLQRVPEQVTVFTGQDIADARIA